MASKRITVRPVAVDTTFQDTLQAAARQGDAAWFERFLALGFSPLITVKVDDTQASGAMARPLDTPLLNATIAWDPSGQVPMALLKPFWDHPKVRGDGLLVKHLQHAWRTAHQAGHPAFLRAVAERMDTLPDAIRTAFLKEHLRTPGSLTEKFWTDHLQDSKTLVGSVNLPFFGPWITALRDWIVPEEWASGHRMFGLYETVRQNVRDAHGAPLGRLWSLGVPIDAALLLAPVQAWMRYTDARSSQDAQLTAADLINELVERGVDCSGWTLGQAGPTIAAIAAGVPRDTPIMAMIQDHMVEMGRGGTAVIVTDEKSQAALDRLRVAMVRWERAQLLAVTPTLPVQPSPPRSRL